ncbi:MAG: hypothetical protein HY904_18940 [Deltaproteobacteria bacterium]|nr:hypothetical protein [Deltaproteobacteria bacterium]
MAPTLLLLATLLAPAQEDAFPLSPGEAAADENPWNARGVAARLITGTTTCTLCSSGCCGVGWGLAGGTIILSGLSSLPQVNTPLLAAGAGACGVGVLLALTLLLFPVISIPLGFVGLWDWQTFYWVAEFMLTMMTVMF